MERLYLQQDNGPDIEIIDSEQHDSLMTDIEAGIKLSRVKTVPPKNTRRLILNNAEDAKERARWAANITSRLERESRTVVITVDDQTMPIAIEELLLQHIADEAAKIKVAIRIAKARGVNAGDVDVKTYAEYYGS